jgi:hypothetical protein
MSKTTKKPVARKGTKSAKGATAKKGPATKAAGSKANAAAGNGKAKAKKLSAIDAAAKVLEGAKNPMTTKEMITAMAAKKLWKSPGGKTPHATLYSAILREISTKGKDARFKKSERGKFAAKG